jgi:hypothetical protein
LSDKLLEAGDRRIEITSLERGRRRRSRGLHLSGGFVGGWRRAARADAQRRHPVFTLAHRDLGGRRQIPRGDGDDEGS